MYCQDLYHGHFDSLDLRQFYMGRKMVLRKKNILIVDDSALMRRLISDIINSDERFSVIDTAMNGLEAFDLVTLNPKKYDAIILDINMPKMNGIQFLEQLEKVRVKQKIIIVSTIAKEGAKETIRCLELGAFDFVTKPESYIEAKEETFKTRILSVLLVATGFDPVFSSVSGQAKSVPTFDKGLTIARQPLNSDKMAKTPHKQVGRGAKKLIALACSTGGPKALQQVIPLLPANLDAPLVLVQHMPAGFTQSLAQRLDEMSQVTVKEAAHGDILKKGHVYIAKGGYHMRVIKKGGNYQISLSDEPAIGGLRPCADIMYESLVNSDYDDIICVVLTGMGADGTSGVKQLNGKKNIYVIAQNEATCTVYGMPKVVAETGLVDDVVPLDGIANAITKNTGVQ